MPLRDAHLHLAELGEELSCIQLADCRSREECLERIAVAAGFASACGGWVRAVGARNESWPDPRWPAAQEVDEAAHGRPAIIESFDHHALVASAAALSAAGIDRDTPDPPRGLIERSAGEPTGLLLEAACQLVRRAMPAPTHDDLLAHLRAAVAELRRHGIVEAHDMLARPVVADALFELDSRGELDLTILLYAPREHFEELAMRFNRRRSPHIRLAGLKIFTDGTLNSRTALMLHDYAEPIPGLPRGKPIMSSDEIEESIRFADSRGYPVAAHAIGDAAVRACLDAIERVRPGTPGQRIEHAQFIDEADIPRFARLGVIASMQPCHLLTDIEAIRRFTPHRAARAFPLRDLIDAARAAGRDPSELIYLGSDAPIVPPDPADNLQAAVHRRRANMPVNEAIALEQAIKAEEVGMCSTQGATN